jgi:hypothetical protein
MYRYYDDSAYMARYHQVYSYSQRDVPHNPSERRLVATRRCCRQWFASIMYWRRWFMMVVWKKFEQFTTRLFKISKRSTHQASDSVSPIFITTTNCETKRSAKSIFVSSDNHIIAFKILVEIVMTCPTIECSVEFVRLVVSYTFSFYFYTF